MLFSLTRKIRQLASDKTLRRWIAGRILGEWPGEPPFKAHCPPYLEGYLPLIKEQPTPPVAFAGLPDGPPQSPIVLPLPGLALEISPGDEQELFTRPFKDVETLLGLHRFAWLPLLGNDANPAWVQALWRAWRQDFGYLGGLNHDLGSNRFWTWHPYTATERAINILDFGARRGLPAPLEDTKSVLAAHAPAIAAKLEYFGDHHTSNHLSNNGRGLYLLGLALGLEKAAAMGKIIMLEEAKRLFHASGILREGSTHYHLLLARNYASAWLAARRLGREEEAPFQEIAARLMAAIPYLTLPGGMPLVGDVSPDCPPGFLSCLVEGSGGWASLLDQDSRQDLLSLRSKGAPDLTESLRQAGWLKAVFGPWSGLWHADPEGFCHMPGHGHQDCGGFELHHLETPIFIDPGRGAYGETGDAAFYRSARAHNTLLVDGKDPFPPNKPYYSGAFRQKISGPAPELRQNPNGVSLRHFGFERLGGVGALTRDWRFKDNALIIKDQLEGKKASIITRLLHTPLACQKHANGVVLQGSGVAFRLRAPGSDICLRPATQWLAYGQGQAITAIEMRDECDLPWSGEMILEIA